MEICDHFMVLEIENPNRRDKANIYIIVCYIPPKKLSFRCTQCSGDYFGDLSTLVHKYSKLGKLYVTGDLNGQTGNVKDFLCQSNTECIYSHICNYEIEWIPPPRLLKDNIVNDYGNDLLNLCKSSSLFIVNGRYETDKVGNFTRVGTTGKSVVDYLIVNRESYNLISHFSVSDNLLVSDHRAICFNISFCSLKPTEQSHENSHDVSIEKRVLYLGREQSAFITECLFDEIGTADYNMFLHSMLLNNDVDVVAKNFQNFITNTVNRVLKKNKTKSKKNKFPANQWYDEDCKAMKQQLHHVNEEETDGFLNLQREYKKNCCKERNENINKL